ncbi:MAG: hypothetical protein K8I00_11015 [Candidatus Omnitrophica bacterium]|nr:hypothetical protein [Candidatus Omnitrophota bacterium]
MKFPYMLVIVMILAATSIGAGMSGDSGRYQVFTAKIRTMVDRGDKMAKEEVSEELLKVDTQTGEVWHLVSTMSATGHRREWKPLIINEPALNFPK